MYISKLKDYDVVIAGILRALNREPACLIRRDTCSLTMYSDRLAALRAGRQSYGSEIPTGSTSST
ncbi:MAG: hypothetical protein MZV63_29700 [Marinilabiliales bacterium]|nr:hypothetical protein [Marinilabiliales bacterium]